MGFQPYGSFVGADVPANRYKDLYADTFYLSREMLLMDQAVIRSHNYSPGTAGFILRQDGTVEINGLTVAEDIQSSNFVTGESGYFLDYSTGDAEFNSTLARGTFATGAATGTRDPYIVIGESGASQYMKFYSDEPGENYPGAVYHAYFDGSGGGFPDYLVMSLVSGSINATYPDMATIALGSQNDDGTLPTIQPYVYLQAAGANSSFTGGAGATSLDLRVSKWTLSAETTSNGFVVMAADAGANQHILWTTASTDRWYFPSGQGHIVAVGDYHVQAGGGSATAPSFSFYNDTDTGMFRLGSDVLGWSAGGTERFRMSTAGFYHNTSGGPYLKAGASAVGSVAYAFTGDGNTGMHWEGADDGRLVAGGSSIAQFTTGHFGPGADDARTLGNSSFRWSQMHAVLIYSTGSYSNTTANAANVYINSLGRLYRSTSGSKYKRNIKPVDLADIVLRPVRYQHTGDRRVHYGFVAEDLAEQDKRLAVIEDGEVESYDDRALAAVLAAKINRLEERLTALEQRGILETPEV